MNPSARALLEPKKHAKSKKGSDSAVNSPNPSTSLSITNGATHSTRPSYDPRALLNPKGARVPPKSTPRRSDQSDIMAGNDSPALEHSNGGRRGMIEDLYSIQQRAEPPMKRIKLSPGEESGSKSKFSTQTGSGIISAHLRPDPNSTNPVNIHDLVDLTKDDDVQDTDDDVTLIRSVNVANEQEVCFGGLWTMVHAHAVPKPEKTVTAFAQNQWPITKCSLHRVPSENTIIEVKDHEGFIFGRVAPDMAAVLAPVMDSLRRIRTLTKLIPRHRHDHEWPHQPCSSNMKMSLNVFGRRGDVEKIGKIFGQHNIWFRTPISAPKDIPIVNPHEKQIPTLGQNTLNKGIHHHLNDNRTIEEATQAVSKLFDHYANSSKPLDETEPPAIIRSPLLPHQKQALTFMLSKESPRSFGSKEEDNSSLWRKQIRANGSISYEELVSGIQVKDEPEQIYGGLLADAMGLGKTLEALSLVATTMGEAHQFGTQNLIRADATETVLMTQSRATLIVAPVSTVKNWEDQITEHMRAGIKYYVYHGAGREKNLYKLANYDIVISTYGTIAAECSKRKSVFSPIQQIRWFRIILDEAHTIREPKASQSQAIYSLFAQRRWCLTGTPIQNRIDDLGSLTRFLRLYPYDTTARFQQYVKGPAVSGKDPNHLKSLRIFVDSFTLRRLKDKINLPNRQDLIEKLDFSAEEQQIYNFFKRISSNQIKHAAANKTPLGKASGIQQSQVLRGIMTLRLISAHGRELLKENDLEKLKGITPQEAIDLDDENTPILTERTAYESLALVAEAGIDMCKNCDKRIGGDSPQYEEVATSTRAYVLPCLDIICPDCFSGYKREIDMMDDRQKLDCPFCTLPITAQYVAINRPIDEVLEMQPEVQDQEFKRGDYRGPHTKTRALIADLHQMYKDSLEYEERGEAPLKCVVFSEFTSHLDLIERALDTHGWNYIRIDGSMSLSKRKKVLDELEHDNDARILLASIKAAGQGLNLTAASRAFIMEPLWNPAAEAQAVDRIYRIGQKREVIIKRYQMNESIELAVVQLQIKKQKMADLTVNKNHQTLSKKQTREEHLKELLELFK